MTEPWVIRKGGAFYRSNYAGYTVHPEAAGLYTQEEAEGEAKRCTECSAHRFADFRDELVRNKRMAQEAIDKIDTAILAAT
jgi:hypothetical protein